MGMVAAFVLVGSRLLTLIPGVPSTVTAIGLIAIVAGFVLMVTFSFRVSRQAQVSFVRAFGRALKDGSRALWEFAP